MIFFKPFEDFVNEEFRVIPKQFYLVVNLTDRVKEALVTGHFKGLTGISDNIDIINRFLDIRDVLIVMDGVETLRLNPNMYKIDYHNPHQLVSNNFYLINRILQNKDIYYSNIFAKISDNYQRTKYFKDYKYREKYKYINNIAKYWQRRYFELSDIADKEKPKVNNLYDFVNWVMKKLPELKVETKNNIPYGDIPVDIKEVRKEDLYFIFENGLKEIAKTFEGEGEWIIKEDKITKNRDFILPKNTKLYFKLFPTTPDEVKRYKTIRQGLYGEWLEKAQKFIEESKLEQKYDIEFVEGFMKIYDIVKQTINK